MARAKMKLFTLAVVALTFWPATLLAADAQNAEPQAPALDVLSAGQWKKADDSVDSGLAWLALKQQPDGSFPTAASGQPAVTSLAVMAFLSRGHLPGAGSYGKQLDRAIDFVLAQQQPEGLLFGSSTEMPVTDWNQGAHTANYNHAICGLMLGEVFG